MGILDEAIREHLELKRQHGADDSELKQLEDQAFGPPERPGSEESGSDTAAEAPTEFMAQPDGEGERPADAAEKPPPARREPAAGMADIQEPPPEPAAEEEEEAEETPAAEEPAEEEQPAAEHRAVSGSPAEHSTEERHAIADQPTEMYDVEEEFAPANSGETSDEELVAEEVTEPRLGPADPVAVPDADEEQGDEEDDFFDEKRLSDELDQALEAPLEPQREREPEPPSEEHESEPPSEEHEAEPASGEREVEHEQADEEEHADEDVLEETPDFLEETPEDDELWFEQKPPKDFDFDD